MLPRQFALLPLLLLAPPERPVEGCEGWNPLHGAPGLHCIELVPRGEFSGVSGRVRLIPASSPFGLAVTRDGVPRVGVEVELVGLPAADSLSYMVWVAPPSLAPLTRLGPAANGRTRLGEVALERFIVFVTAERDTAPDTMGTLVLRGMSPSSVMLPHPFLLPADEGGHAHEAGWEMPPVNPLAPLMSPGMEHLVPAVTPWHPGRGADHDTLPPLRARQLLRLADGDSLDLTAGLVRRSLAGRSFTAYAFNGQSPGPLLQVERGARITVLLRNRLDLPTSVHWHGIRLDARFDGAVGVSQEAVPPGGTFRYELVFPDAGIYWYHPHVREDIQQELGLYGNILVRGDSLGLPPVDREEVVMLDDILLGEAAPIAFGEEHATHALMGRFGNVLLVNGEPDWSLDAAAGSVTRLYFTNASNARTFNVAVDGARLKLVAGDMGPVAADQWVESVVIGPAERWVVDAQFAEPGRFAITNRARGVEPRSRAFIAVVDTLGWATVTPGQVAGPAAKRFDTLDRGRGPALGLAGLDSLRGREPDRTLVLSVRTGELPLPLLRALREDTAWVQPVEWAGLMPMMDWLPTGREIAWVLRDSTTGQENMALDWQVPLGGRQLVRLVNDRHTLHPMHHPIHLHGQRFVVVARNGEPVDDHVWKDTVIVPAGTTVDLLVEFDNPGRWMIHCHIAEHLEAGMHSVVTVGGRQ